ncbi:MAG: hypothetical protein ACXACX_16045, partial [Candidatus Hodarchaeales archaeon]
MAKRNEKLIGALDIALEAVGICEIIHNRTGAIKIPLDDVANEMGKGMTKKSIQEGFWLLVELGILGDDGDYDHMNYNDEGNNELTELLKKIKIEEMSKEAESPEIEF